MEHFGQNFGYTLYRTVLHKAPAGELAVDEVHDFARVYLDGELAGTIDRRASAHSGLRLPAISEGSRLDILVANDGRINHTHEMRFENKGITHAVSLGSMVLKGWMVYLLPLGEPGTDLLPKKYNSAKIDGPAFFFGQTLKSMLEKRGVKIRGRVRRGPAPKDAVPYLLHQSETLDVVLKKTNKSSSNFMAETLLKIGNP